MAAITLKIIHETGWKVKPLKIEGLTIHRCSGVFRPGRLTKTSLLLAENMAVYEGFEVLDLGCGTGILSLLAAKKARRVVAVDSNPKAVECTKLNAEANGLKDRIDVRLGSLFSPLKPGERFNLILFNPPYLPGKPKSLLEAGWLNSGSLVLEFLRKAPKWLKPGGLCQLVYSSLGALTSQQIIETAESFGFKLVERKDFKGILETFTVYLFALRKN